ncbi:MAG: hypothetical protein EXR28_14150 [Betaproteobacteria bacterium]|nr:hypothetical protein [Betaproteobacteria bacterium]
MAAKKLRSVSRGALTAKARPRAKAGATTRVSTARVAVARHLDSGAGFCAVANTALRRGDHDSISDACLRRVLTAAVKLYAAKMDGQDKEIPPFDKNRVNATETVVASCAMIRSAGLNLFDVAMWFRRSAAGL